MTSRFIGESATQEAPPSLQRQRQWIKRIDALLPPGRNRWFHQSANAWRAAQRTARYLETRLNTPIRVEHHVYPALGLRHYHLSTPDGRHFRIRFFYGLLGAPMLREVLAETSLSSARSGRETIRLTAKPTARRVTKPTIPRIVTPAARRATPPTSVTVPRARPKGYRRPKGVAIALTASMKKRIATTARNDFERKRPDYARRLGVKSGEHIHHAIELQALTRYPGVFTKEQLNAFGNMRGIPEELGGKLQLHNRSIRDQWNYHYRLLDAQIVARSLKPGTAGYNHYVRNYLTSARDEIDWSVGSFFRDEQ